MHECCKMHARSQLLREGQRSFGDFAGGCDGFCSFCSSIPGSFCCVATAVNVLIGLCAQRWMNRRRARARAASARTFMAAAYLTTASASASLRLSCVVEHEHRKSTRPYWHTQARCRRLTFTSVSILRLASSSAELATAKAALTNEAAPATFDTTSDCAAEPLSEPFCLPSLIDASALPAASVPLIEASEAPACKQLAATHCGVKRPRWS